MGLPKLTALQFAVIDCLQGRKLKGRELRDKLISDKGIKREGPAFYMVMSRMEAADLISSETTGVIIEGKTYHEKTYWVSGHGRKAYDEARCFFEGQPNWDVVPQPSNR